MIGMSLLTLFSSGSYCEQYLGIRHYSVNGENGDFKAYRHETSVIFTACERTGYSARGGYQLPNFPAMHSVMNLLSSLPLYCWLALIISALGLAAMGMRALETDEARAKSAERKRRTELRLLADKISGYGRNVHQRYPTGDVVVSERDLAEQLRKPRDAVATALDLLLREQKVQRAPLRGYWKLNL
jgi:hypothetical protein